MSSILSVLFLFSRSAAKNAKLSHIIFAPLREAYFKCEKVELGNIGKKVEKYREEENKEAGV